jgi:hypothetical protein
MMEDLIDVSEDGIIVNRLTNRIIGNVTGGYKRFSVLGESFAVNRAVYLKYISTQIPPGFVVHHKDENKLNNHYSNLEAISESENIRISFKGTPSHLKFIDNNGSKNGMAKLTEQNAIDIRALRKLGISVTKLSKEFNVSETCIKHVINFKTFKNIPE